MVKIIGVVVGVIVAGLIFYASFTYQAYGVRRVLLEQYVSVETLSRDYFSFACLAGKQRAKFDYTATRRDGTKAHGYVCHTGLISFIPSIVHEK